MKPNIRENNLDHIIARILETNGLAARAALAAASPLNAELDFDQATVHRQVRHRNTHGTADLVLHLWKNDQLRALILIENKIDAGFTPDQPQRYRISRDSYLVDKPALVVATLLISPSIYIAGSRLKDIFDGTLSYERILLFTGQEDRSMMEIAIERASSPYEPVPVESVMSFF